MHPDLLNNSLFLRYYEQWQKDPDSVVFAPIADFFLRYGLVKDAQKICEQGLKRHPNLTTGRLVMAKVYIAQEKLDEAANELNNVFNIMPSNQLAKRLLDEINLKRFPNITNIEKLPLVQQEESVFNASLPNKWETLTMAKIYASQGHIKKAQRIFKSILERDPNNKDALKGLASINT